MMRCILDRRRAVFGSGSKASRGLARRICAPIGQARPKRSSKWKRKSFLSPPLSSSLLSSPASGCESASRGTNGSPFGVRPTSREATQSNFGAALGVIQAPGGVQQELMVTLHILCQLAKHQISPGGELMRRQFSADKDATGNHMSNYT